MSSSFSCEENFLCLHHFLMKKISYVFIIFLWRKFLMSSLFSYEQNFLCLHHYHNFLMKKISYVFIIIIILLYLHHFLMKKVSYVFIITIILLCLVIKARSFITVPTSCRKLLYIYIYAYIYIMKNLPGNLRFIDYKM